MQIDLEIIKPQGPPDYNTLILKISILNKFDKHIAEQFELFCYTLIRGGIKKFIFDLKDLKYIDSSGIGKIINIAKVLRQQRGNIALSRVPQDIMDVFKLVKLDTFVKIFLSNEECINYLKLT